MTGPLNAWVLLIRERCTCYIFAVIESEEIEVYIREALPGASVVVTDRTGTMDHYGVAVVSALFSGKSRLDRQRMVYAALQEPMQDGRIHALEVRSQTPEEAFEAGGLHSMNGGKHVC